MVIRDAGPCATGNQKCCAAGNCFLLVTGKTKDVQSHRGWGYGHFAVECRNKHVMVVHEDGEYDSASDYDGETLALISAQQEDNEDTEQGIEVMGAEDADNYRSMVAHRVLSVQLSQEQNQRHNLFHTRGVLKDRAIRIIIDGGSCNNLASIDMVEKLSLPTRQHPHPYHIQWFDNTGKL